MTLPTGTRVEQLGHVMTCLKEICVVMLVIAQTPAKETRALIKIPFSWHAESIVKPPPDDGTMRRFLFQIRHAKCVQIL